MKKKILLGLRHQLVNRGKIKRNTHDDLSPISNTILPICAPDSISPCASPASARGNTLKITGRILFASISGHIFSFNAAAMALLNSTLRGRKVEVVLWSNAAPQDFAEIHLCLVLPRRAARMDR